MDLDAILADRNISIDDVVRRCQTQELNRTRGIHGQYHTLFPTIRKYPDRFRDYLRMDPNTFDYILVHIEESLTKNWCNLHQAIEPEHQLVLTLRLLASGDSCKSLGFAFKMAKSTVSTIASKVIKALWEFLQPIHMPVPTADELKEVAEDFFNRWNFPNCVGAIDCRHMKINQPPHSGTLFYNWKKFYSIKLQAVVDANYRFLCIDVGDYGSNHDSTTFFNSSLYEGLKYGRIKLPQDDKLPGTEILLPYCFVGDGAYMLMQHMMKPFRGKNLDEQKKIFNKRLSRARVVVECAFGHLVQIWRICNRMENYRPDKAILITKTCCLLRNILIDMEGRTSNPAYENIVAFGNALIGDIEHEQEFIVGAGEHVRTDFLDYFMENPI